MRIAVLRERRPGERRVALVPESVKRLVSRGFQVSIEQGAGAAAWFDDQAFLDAGARIVEDPAALLAEADLLAKINLPSDQELEWLGEHVALIGFLSPLSDPMGLGKLAKKKLTAFALELVPRTSLAQSMDALSSLSTINGYKSVLLAAGALPRFFPMLTTAAGTIAPAKVLVLGAGVAGLQAIATARRLGAVVESFDQRPAAKEQVESLGARFVSVPSEGENAETEEGYASELSERYRQRQAELIGERVARSDAVIATALIPGKRAPILITREQVSRMPPGSVIVDLAAEQGGNCELTEPGKTIEYARVTIIGPLNLASTMPSDASRMVSRNVEKLLLHLATPEGLKLERGDAITIGCLVTIGGEILVVPR